MFKVKNTQLDANLKVLGGFFVFFNSWGVSLSFGSFQRYYSTVLLPGESQSTLAWIGTLATFLLMALGFIAGSFHDHGYNRSLMIGGAFLNVFGLFMVSLSKTLAELFLSQGVCFGLGCGLMITPTITNISKSFTKFRSLALGLALTGSSVGGVIYSVMFEGLLDRVGFPCTIRIIAFVALFNSIFIVAFLARKGDATPADKRAARDPYFYKNWLFLVYCLAGFTLFLSYYVPFLYLPAYGASVGADSELQYYLPAIVQGAAFLGRILPAYAADKAGPLNAATFLVFVAAIMLLAWIGVTTVPGLIAWSVIWGFNSGILIVLPGAVTVLLTPSAQVLGFRNGLVFSIAGFGVLLGGPIGGAIIDERGFLGMQIFAGVIMLATGLLCLTLIVGRRRKVSNAAQEIAAESLSSANDGEVPARLNGSRSKRSLNRQPA